ncbi:hypothetical protein FHW83_001433 [Duganella sp. SG902]|uniref:hypothetical protein n=1 Tax=Duganella sp. SG902 TaxID=2587016 RepID=UPI00159E9667|nr:hypothetical protein [Duganella sp. SG902]NVM75646.1 hypothetical protein [Duganella sp. SG902]
MSTPFDSHKYAKRLMEAGMSPALADIQAETTGEIMNELNRISSKLEEVDVKNNAKIDLVENKLNTKIDQVKLELEAKIAESRAEVVRWVVGIAILQSSVLTGFMLKLLH